MSLATQIQNLATRVATECKSIRSLVSGGAADLSALTTTQKGSLVAAVNELKGAIDALSAVEGGATINDAATSSTQVWSSSKTSQEITGAIDAVLSGAPAALDTLEELAAAIGDDADFAATVTAALGHRVRHDAPQSLTSGQQTQARSNIGAASAADVGDTATNFVATFEAGLV